ncbi:uncharacterized protein LOC128550106 [Mercenaria mercenaria]|uniref:uncharacterized protein LOC128550106 n=1 Tax=Mercenaria mercenaria TaxID=6596 RepID=UPI00234F6962|nr:uncharacterized protein LOC128550106 [Mercenaria mercenaria]
MQPMLSPRQYKIIVEECMEKQVKAIDCDIASCNEGSRTYRDLKRIRQSIEQKRKELISESVNDEQAAFQRSMEETTEQPKEESETTDTKASTLSLVSNNPNEKIKTLVNFKSEFDRCVVSTKQQQTVIANVNEGK